MGAHQKTDPPEFRITPQKVTVERMEYRYKFRDEPDRHGPDDILLAWAVPTLTESWSVYINVDLWQRFGLPPTLSGVLLREVSRGDAKAWVIGMGKILKAAWKTPMSED